MQVGGECGRMPVSRGLARLQSLSACRSVTILPKSIFSSVSSIFPLRLRLWRVGEAVELTVVLVMVAVMVKT